MFERLSSFMHRRPASHGYLAGLGAEPVAYGPGLGERVRALAPDGVDAAVDAIGNDEAVDVSLGLVPDRRRIATLVGGGRAPKTGIQVLGGGPGGDAGTEIRDAARYELVALAAAGKLTVQVARMYSLRDVSAAHRQIRRGHVRGKLILVMS